MCAESIGHISPVKDSRTVDCAHDIVVKCTLLYNAIQRNTTRNISVEKNKWGLDEFLPPE